MSFNKTEVQQELDKRLKNGSISADDHKQLSDKMDVLYKQSISNAESEETQVAKIIAEKVNGLRASKSSENKEFSANPLISAMQQLNNK